MNGFEKRRQQKKKQILESLTDMVMTRNFKEIGVREIAQQAGVSPGSIYNFFGNKEELAKEVFYHQMEEEGKDFIQMMNSDLPFEEKMNKMYEVSVNNQESITSEGMKNFIFTDPAFKAYVEQYANTVAIPEIMKLIEQGKGEGKVTGGVSAEAIMIFMNGIITMLGNPSIAENLTVDLRKELGNLFLYGVLGKKE
ncbi:TetR family transcriptional regulator [Paenibacillus sp. FSL R7-269]|uniref:TetR/AcrR family transcriptional regulator n=1 Tax=Paenibacillus sp. FSL R7-269 TaxID=1226755 RepID=UPI0003E2031E|nr:TetR/AcrR family transcriptional regulator [Paenibacillus sp. FSL R7-269]ETT32951.1 TetR family transcriptional regulator [Paenibacillus sp. FSL R7-269]